MLSYCSSVTTQYCHTQVDTHTLCLTLLLRCCQATSNVTALDVLLPDNVLAAVKAGLNATTAPTLFRSVQGILLVLPVEKGYSDKLPPSTSFFANSRTLMGCTDPLRRGGRRTPSVSSRVGSLPLYADVRFHIPMTHRNDVIRYSDAPYGNALPMVQQLQYHNLQNAVVATPRFSTTPWFCDGDQSDRLPYPVRHESYLQEVVVPLLRELYCPQCKHVDLIGFSKSGWGSISLLLRNPGQ